MRILIVMKFYLIVPLLIFFNACSKNNNEDTDILKNIELISFNDRKYVAISELEFLKVTHGGGEFSGTNKDDFVTSIPL